MSWVRTRRIHGFGDCLGEDQFVEAAAWFAGGATLLAALVALGLGLWGDYRGRQARRDAETAAIGRHHVDLLLQLYDAYAVCRSANTSSADKERAFHAVPLLLRSLPTEYAALLRSEFDVGKTVENGTTWQKYATKGESFNGAAPASWVQQELADDMNDAMGIAKLVPVVAVGQPAPASDGGAQ